MKLNGNLLGLFLKVYKSLDYKAFFAFSNKELDIISYFHYNRITYHRYDRKEQKWQGIETHMKLEIKY